MKEIIRNIEKTIENISDMRISLSSNGNVVTATLTPAEYKLNGNKIEIFDIFDQGYVINCENVEYDEMSGVYILRSGETEVVVEFKPCF